MSFWVFSPPWPERTYLLSLPNRFIYAPIPKVACSSLKHWMCKLDGVSPQEIKPHVHEFARNRFALKHRSEWTARRLLTSRDFFKFTFVRNPWDRLVSAFANKFLPLEAPAQQVLLTIARQANDTERGNGRSWASRWTGGTASAFADREQESARYRELTLRFTFRQFVDYLATAPPMSCNTHWRPQHLFLGNVVFDFIGRFERIAEDFAAVCDHLGIRDRLPHTNSTVYQQSTTTCECYADWPLEALRNLPGVPNWRRFYTSDLAGRVADVYQQDVAQFGYSFDDDTASVPFRNRFSTENAQGSTRAAA